MSTASTTAPTTDPINDALAAKNAADAEYKNVYMRVHQDKMTVLTNLTERKSDVRSVADVLDTYFNTYPGREGHEISMFQKWVHAIADEAESKYIDTTCRGLAELDAASANLRAATKVYDDLVALKQMYDTQIAGLKQQLADTIAPIQ